MKILKVEINDFNGAMFAEHNYPCPVFSGERAVLIIGKTYFQPSWKAQNLGYKLVKAENFIQRILLKYFFKSEFRLGEQND